jgi:hypothetical protein
MTAHTSRGLSIAPPRNRPVIDRGTLCPAESCAPRVVGGSPRSATAEERPRRLLANPIYSHGPLSKQSIKDALKTLPRELPWTRHFLADTPDRAFFRDVMDFFTVDHDSATGQKHVGLRGDTAVAVQPGTALISAAINVVAFVRFAAAPSNVPFVTQLLLFSAAAGWTALSSEGPWVARTVTVGALGAGLGALLERWIYLPSCCGLLAIPCFWCMARLATRSSWLAALAAAGSLSVGWIAVRVRAQAAA